MWICEIDKEIPVQKATVPWFQAGLKNATKWLKLIDKYDLVFSLGGWDGIILFRL